MLPCSAHVVVLTPSSAALGIHTSDPILCHHAGDDALSFQAFVTTNNTVFLFVAVSVAYGMVRQSRRVHVICSWTDDLEVVPCQHCQTRVALPERQQKSEAQSCRLCPLLCLQGASLVGQNARLPLVADAAETQVSLRRCHSLLLRQSFELLLALLMLHPSHCSSAPPSCRSTAADSEACLREARLLMTACKLSMS